MRLKTLLLMLACATTAFALSGCGSSEESGSGGEGGEQDRSQTQAEDTQREDTAERAEAPEDKSLTVSIPEMQNVDQAEVPNAAYNDEQALRDHAAIHVASTGYPWQEVANVYLAGHALGYQGTPSWHAFRDLGQLEEGDEIYVTDANGTEYTYEVFRESFDVEPTQVEVIQPIEGRNILSLQSCTLPDYEDRVIVQAELTETEPSQV